MLGGDHTATVPVMEVLAPAFPGLHAIEQALAGKRFMDVPAVETATRLLPYLVTNICSKDRDYTVLIGKHQM
jgi:hypothetical protein